ncbi:MAG TPA: pyridoxamine 5'-phosphate oxidase family protein, partial [Solirubrobacterales bacterium]|nr:pyridoxamine 5'-phosphate oxidase family protein [Solirubrobacterales bacterium]
MSVLTPEATRLIESDALAHLVTLNRDGSPQLSCVWVGLDGDEIVSGHMMKRLKLKNVERDPR